MFDKDDKVCGKFNGWGVYFGEDLVFGVFIMCVLFVGDERLLELLNNVLFGGNVKVFVVFNMYFLLRGDDEIFIMLVLCVLFGVEVKVNGVFRVCSVFFGNE